MNNSNQIQEKRIIGLMSGTSLDGLDIVHVKFHFSSSQNVDFEIVNAETVAYPQALLERLKMSAELNGSDLFQLHHDLQQLRLRHLLRFELFGHIQLVGLSGQ